MCLTFVRSVHSHVVDVVKLAMESCLEIRIWGKHALRFGIDEFVTQCPEQRLLLLRLFNLAHDFAQYALLVPCCLYRWRIAAYARAVVGVAEVMRA